ncbi:MAG: hypothetical protein HY535_05955 [Chloroflexi bacterium]|nr:hypothetical protein [Chloroflexota bacterium]
MKTTLSPRAPGHWRQPGALLVALVAAVLGARADSDALQANRVLVLPAS